jgi:RimJ/RimL family protein N-acetyltransferase
VGPAACPGAAWHTVVEGAPPVTQIFLETDRVRLRRLTPADLDNLIGLDADPEVMRYISGGRPTPRAVVAHRVLPAFLGYYARSAGFGFWAAIEKPGGEFLGWFHLRPPRGAGPDEAELGYRLRRAAWGRGYATEVSRALIRKAFTELGVRRVVASTDAAHTASRRVMEKAGMTLVRTLRAPWPELPDGPEREAVEYAVSKADWEQHEADGRAPASACDPPGRCSAWHWLASGLRTRHRR